MSDSGDKCLRCGCGHEGADVRYDAPTGMNLCRDCLRDAAANEAKGYIFDP